MENRNYQNLSKNNEPDEMVTFWAITSYIIFLLPLISKYKKNEFVRFHLRQGFIWFLSLLVAYIFANFTLRLWLKTIIYMLVFVLWSFGIINVLLGKTRPLPIIGWVAEKLF